MACRYVMFVFCLIALLPGCRKDKPAPPPTEADPPADSPEMLYPVTQNGQMGYIDRHGREVIGFRFHQAESFSEGLAAVESAGMWGFIDRRGQWVIEPDFVLVDRAGFADGLAGVLVEGKWGCLDQASRWVISPEYPRMIRFRQGRALMRKGDKYGYLDTTGQWAIQPRFSGGQWFSDGLAAVQVGGVREGRRIRGGKWGFVNLDGKMAIPSRFAWAGSFSEGIARVGLKDPTGEIVTQYINTSGNVLFTGQPWPGGAEFCQSRAMVTAPDGRVGFIDKTGQLVIDTKFLQGRSFSDGLAAVLTYTDTHPPQKKWGYIDHNGKIVIPPQFASATSFADGLATVRRNPADPPIVIDKSGKTVWPNTKADKE
ncbi:MAG: WG repeat-containing protein [Phycisphaerae bacterium]|nr:WG repeat-containing protein [Phycisphaerae bacterium]